MSVTELLGVFCACAVAVAVVAWLAFLGINEQEKVGQARLACIEAGGVFIRDQTCVWSQKAAPNV